MTESVRVFRPAAIGREAIARPTFAGFGRFPVPAHIAVIMGLSAGAYALALAGITGLESASESAIAADRAPAIAAIETSQRTHTDLERRLEAARRSYEDAAAAYAATGDGFTAMNARLAALADVMTEISGSAASLPTSVKLPAVTRSVSSRPAPVVHATTTASGAALP